MNFTQDQSETEGRIRKGLRWYNVLIPFLVVLLTVLAFFPSLQNGFVDWDDDANFLDNSFYRGLSWNNLRWMFTTVYLSNYRPLTWVTFGFDYILWGMNPFGYHLTSLLLHGVNGLLVYFLALRLLSLSESVEFASHEVRLRVVAGLAALIFSIHPLRVEPVVWLSARNHLLSGLFYLWAILCYLRAAGNLTRNSRRWRWFAAAVILYGLSLLAQLSGITFPLILLARDIYPLRRLGGGPGRWLGAEARLIWLEKVPFLLLAASGGLFAMLAKQEVLFSFEQLGVLRRVAQSVYELVFYVWKTVIPVGLSPLYQLPFDFNPWAWPFLVSGVVLLVVSLGVFALRHRWPAALASWVYYLVIVIPYVLLVPVLGSAQNGPQVTADRYSYLSCLPWAVLSGVFLLHWQNWLSERGGWRTVFLGTLPAVAIVAALMSLTWQQTQVWHDPEVLWKHAVAVTDNSPFRSMGAHYNLGNVLRKKGSLDEAAEHYRQSLSLNPLFPETHNNLALVLVQSKDLAESQKHFQEAVRLRPSYSEARANLGNVLSMQGDPDGAIQQYREALKISPQLDGVRYNLALLLAKTNHFEDAKVEFQEFLKRQPNSVEGHYIYGTILLAQRDFENGMRELGEVLRLRHDFADAHITLARVLWLQGKREEAAKHYQEALRILKSDNKSGPSQ